MASRKRTGGDVEIAFGKALARARKEAGVSQERLALESGYHPTYISMLERGLQNPSLRVILAVSRVLKISPTLLVERTHRILGGP
jgi:transcriptional regulator with XRE-family HTH domain